jgi:hypothetical protein
MAAALPVLLPVCGRTLLWSQSSGPSSGNSGEHSMTWEELSGKFTLGLEQHEQTLKELGGKLRTSEASLRRLTPLYDLSLQQNESLKTYNGQIAERMQERDEDLAAAYAKNDRKDRTMRRLIAMVILLGLPYVVKIALWIAGRFKP